MKTAAVRKWAGSAEPALVGFVSVSPFVVLFCPCNADKTCDYVFCFLDKAMANYLKFSLR